MPPDTKESQHKPLRFKRYSVLVAESLNVDTDAFRAAIRALLTAAPTPMAEIPSKYEPREQKAKRKGR